MSFPFAIKEHTVPAQYIREYPGACLDDQEAEFALHVKQYTPLDGQNDKPGAVTIIGTHANGFPKELYEPFWNDLYISLKARGQEIRNIWIADVVHQGASGVLNEHLLGNDPSWFDHARDLLHMINHFRKDIRRPIVGLGHSMGATSLVNLSLMHPRLLSDLVLIEPVIFDGERSPESRATSQLTRQSMFRRDIWPSRADAATHFKRASFFRSWDPRVMSLWVQYGLRDLPTNIHGSEEFTRTETSEKPVTLSTSKHQEVFTFLRPNFTAGFRRPLTPDFDPRLAHLALFYRVEPEMMYDRLPHLRPPVLYMFGGRSPMSSPETRITRVKRTGTDVGGSGGIAERRVCEHTLEGAGHLLPFEQIKEAAEVIAVWLVKELKTWRWEEQEWTAQWRAKSRKERTMITEDWEKHIGGNPRRARAVNAKL